MIVLIVVYFVAGLATGAAFFAGLATNTRLYVERRSGAAIALHLLRLGGIAAVFGLIASRGPVPLLSALAGFTAARFWMIRRAERQGR